MKPRLTLLLLALLMLFVPTVGMAQVTPEHDQNRFNPEVGLKVYFFHASWCTPCNLMKPNISRLWFEGVSVFPYDIDKYPELKERYAISKIPTIIFAYNGKEVARMVGYVRYQTIRDKYDALTAEYPPRPIPDPLPDLPFDIDDDDSGLDLGDLKYEILK